MSVRLWGGAFLLTFKAPFFLLSPKFVTIRIIYNTRGLRDGGQVGGKIRGQFFNAARLPTLRDIGKKCVCCVKNANNHPDCRMTKKV